MPETLETLLILCPLVFLRVWSTPCGRRRIDLSARLSVVRVSAHVAFGSNKLSSSSEHWSPPGDMRAAVRWMSASVWPERAVRCSDRSGTRLALLVSDRGLRIVLVVLLPLVAAFTLLRSRKSNLEPAGREVSRSRSYALACSFCLVIGAYDGFFGPGTGTFLILAFHGLLGFDYAKAGGTAKLVNLASNLAAVTLFAANMKIAFWAAIPAALCSVAGNWIGSGLAIRRGAGLIRSVLVGVLVLLFARMLYDVVTG